MAIKKILRSKRPHTCDYCGKTIPKGTVYYREKHIIKDEDMIFYTYVTKTCPKCVFKSKQGGERFKRFKPTCEHKITDTVYGYIPGECVMEPQYDECRICGTRGV